MAYQTRSVSIGGKELFHVEGTWLDVTPNPNRFLVRKSVEDGNSGSRIIVITNWFEDLLRKVPVKR